MDLIKQALFGYSQNEIQSNAFAQYFNRNIYTAWLQSLKKFEDPCNKNQIGLHEKLRRIISENF